MITIEESFRIIQKVLAAGFDSDNGNLCVLPEIRPDEKNAHDHRDIENQRERRIHHTKVFAAISPGSVVRCVVWLSRCLS
jgi:hypothetical protein